MLETEVDTLSELGEIEISDEVALKLKVMSSTTTDRKLRHQLALFVPFEVRKSP